MKITYTGYTDICNAELIADEHEEFQSALWGRYNMVRDVGEDYEDHDTQAAWRGWLSGRGFDWEPD